MLILSKVNYIVDMGHPQFAIITLDEKTIRQAIGRIDLVRKVKEEQDDEIYGMSFWGACPAYIETSDMLEMLIEEAEWMTVTKEQLEAHGIKFNEYGQVETEYRTEIDRQLAFEDEIQWRAFPKHGDGEFTTSRIHRDQLDKLVDEARKAA